MLAMFDPLNTRILDEVYVKVASRICRQGFTETPWIDVEQHIRMYTWDSVRRQVWRKVGERMYDTMKDSTVDYILDLQDSQDN